MHIRHHLVPAEKYALKCPYRMTPVGICVHNTANDASAAHEVNYMRSNNKQTSFHLAVDDKEAVQGIPFERNAWHAGDGVHGEGNRNYIGLEICYSKSGGEKFHKAEDTAAELIAQLLKERGWGVDRVKKHQDFSGKYCPHRTLDLGWDRFIKKVREKLEANMADMYTLPSGNAVDLSNRESNIVLAHTWDEVVHQGMWVKKADAKKEVEAIQAQLDAEKDFSKRLTLNTMVLATMLGLSPHASPDQIVAAVKALIDQMNTKNDQSSTQKGTLPETKEVNGRMWSLNGLTIDTEGNMVGNYKRND